MHASLLLTAATLLPLALAAPPRPPYRLPHPIKGRQNDSTAAPTCDFSSTPQPSSTLTPPAAGLSLVLIALGQGTQNYTCGTNLTLAPSSIGALATLYNASCTATSSSTSDTIDTTAATSIGSHFFVDTTTPDFLIPALGNTLLKKVEEAAAPQPSADVKWLRLEAKEGSSSDVKMIYRLKTKGGVAPGSCEERGVGEVVTVGYQAEYWVYA